MSLSKNLSISYFLCTLFFSLSHAASFVITNNCPFTVWAGAVPGGGMQLNPRGGTWTLDVSVGTKGARIWPRTGCSFDGAGRGRCQTGDCGRLLRCQAYGAPPNTLAEYALNQFNNLDFFDISLVEGFNVPMEFSPTSNGCTRGIKCTADINGQCPNELRAPGGCNNPCTVFKTDQYCCNSGSCGPTNYSRFFKDRRLDAYSYPKDDQTSTYIVFKTDQYCCNSGSCGPTNYSKFFKDRCPDAYSYPKDDQTSTFTCPGGTNYKVVFCP